MERSSDTQNFDTLDILNKVTMNIDFLEKKCIRIVQLVLIRFTQQDADS